MRLAFITDVHADVHAVDDALSQAKRLGCDAVVCAGDLVDYGLYPEETIALLRARRIPCIRGNHDRWAVGRTGSASAIHDATGWDLSSDALHFLAELPTAWTAEFDGVRVAVRHGTPRSDMEGIYPEALTAEDAQRWLAQASADVLIVGHTHIAFVAETLGGGMIANPGALLRSPADQPAVRAMIFDRDLGRFVQGPAPGGGTFGVLELTTRRFTVHRASDGSEVTVPRTTVGVNDRRAR